MKTRIGILGLGGVGGYFGGLLAHAYTDSEAIEIVFVARGETQKIIVENGLTIKTAHSTLNVRPKIVSNDPTEIGTLDYLLCATKTYDIEQSLNHIATCISTETIILPLYNGVDAPNRITLLFPNNHVLQGCVYIISMILSPGVIQKTGIYEHLFFGSVLAPLSKLKQLASIFKKASFDSVFAENIEAVVWEKFVFISALATVTSYFNQNIGAVLQSPESKAAYITLLHEVSALAIAKGIAMPIDIIEKTMAKLEKSPPDATSSMHRDFQAGHKTEVNSLTAYVVDEGIKLGIKTPTYQMILADLQKRQITLKV
jgi:2-dehydropantoate 2-reductase